MIEFNREIQCAECPIRHRAVCARCDKDELEYLEQIKFYRNYQAGQPISFAGDEVSFVASVVRGVATINQTLEDGRTQMVGLLLPSDFVGRPGRPTSPFDVTAVTDVTLCCFRRKPFEQILSQSSHIAERLLEMTIDELDAAREWMLILGRKTAREKIASLLCILAKRESTISMTSLRGKVSLDLPLTREAMANYLGLTLETVSRQFSALKADGLIILEGSRRVAIPQFESLLHEAGGDLTSLVSI